MAREHAPGVDFETVHRGARRGIRPETSSLRRGMAKFQTPNLLARSLTKLAPSLSTLA